MKRVFLSTCFYFCIIGCNLIHNSDEIVQGIARFPHGLNPINNHGDIETQIHSQVYETLVQLDGDNETVLPRLAVKWNFSESNKTYTFELRPNVHFHDGTKLTSDDVVYSFNILKDKQIMHTFFDMVDSVKALDELKIVFYLNYVSPVFLQALASSYGLVIVKQADEKSFPVGTGPYRIDTFKPKEDIILKAFSDYWNGVAQVKYIRFRYYRSRQEIEDAIIGDNVDIIYRIPGYSVDRLKWIGKIEYYVQNPRSVFFLGFNNALYPFNDRLLRLAILKAINIPSLVLNVNRGNAAIARGPLPEAFFHYDRLVQGNFDLKESMKILKQKGYGKGLKVNLIFPSMAFNRPTLANIIQSDLAKANIEVNTIYTHSWEEHDRLVKSDSCQLFISGGWPEIAGDMVGLLRDFFYSQSPFNFFHYKNEQVDRWLNEARVEMNRTKREKLVALTVEQILNDVPAIFLYHVKPHFAFNREKIKKLFVDPYGIIQYHRIELN